MSEAEVGFCMHIYNNLSDMAIKKEDFGRIKSY